MDKSPETCSPSVISYAASMRGKYRKTNTDRKVVKHTLAIGSMGVHPQNRGGLYPAGCRCKGLLESVLDVGFSKEEMNSGVVVVEEVPVDEMSSRGKGYTSGYTYNIAACSKDE